MSEPGVSPAWKAALIVTITWLVIFAVKLVWYPDIAWGFVVVVGWIAFIGNAIADEVRHKP